MLSIQRRIIWGIFIASCVSFAFGAGCSFVFYYLERAETTKFPTPNPILRHLSERECIRFFNKLPNSILDKREQQMFEELLEQAVHTRHLFHNVQSRTIGALETDVNVRMVIWNASVDFSAPKPEDIYFGHGTEIMFELYEMLYCQELPYRIISLNREEDAPITVAQYELPEPYSSDGPLVRYSAWIMGGTWVIPPEILDAISIKKVSDSFGSVATESFEACQFVRINIYVGKDHDGPEFRNGLLADLLRAAGESLSYLTEDDESKRCSQVWKPKEAVSNVGSEK